jgi:glycerol uptake facilitator-like aquaporin
MANSGVQTCFFEADPVGALSRRTLVEGFGTSLLMLVATASALRGQQLVPSLPGLGLLISAVAIAGALAGLIVAFGAVSGGHFNPLITVLQWLGGERSLRCTMAYVIAQCAGAVLGALVGSALFAADPNTVVPREGWRMAFSECVASAGLMAIVLGCAHSRLAKTGPFAVAAWLTGAIVALPSTSYANPAIALAAIVATGPIGLDRLGGLTFVAAEIVGALVAFAAITLAYPAARSAEVALQESVST